jgi:transposase
MQIQRDNNGSLQLAVLGILGLDALKGHETVTELATKHELHPTQIAALKQEAIEKLAQVFDEKGTRYEAHIHALISPNHKLQVPETYARENRFCSMVYAEPYWRGVEIIDISISIATLDFAASAPPRVTAPGGVGTHWSPSPSD